MDALLEKAKQIKLLLLDVDGVLSTGMLYYDSHGEVFKPFHAHDGFGIRLLQRAGIAIGIISAKRSEPLVKRLADLNIEHVYLGYEKKLEPYQEIKVKLGLDDQQIAYVGDDWLDLPVLKSVGLSISVANGATEVRHAVDFITQRKGGKGAVREVCEMLLKAQGKYQAMLERYVS